MQSRSGPTGNDRIHFFSPPPPSTILPTLAHSQLDASPKHEILQTLSHPNLCIPTDAPRRVLIQLIDSNKNLKLLPRATLQQHFYILALMTCEAASGSNTLCG